ncbi:MAG: TolC family protein [Bacteroidia bacterium]|jgi:outer membrane protein TolC
MNRFFVFLFFAIAFSSKGQVSLTLDSAIANALRTHPQIQFSQQETEQQKALKRGSFNLENPSLGMEAPYGKKFEVALQQNFQNPVIYIQQAKLGKENILLSEQNQQVTKWQLIRNVRIAYLNLQYAEIRAKQLTYQDSIFRNLSVAAERRYNAGDAGLLEKVSAETKSKEIENLLKQTNAELQNAQFQLQLITSLKDGNIRSNNELIKSTTTIPIEIRLDSLVITQSPLLKYFEQNTLVNKQNLRLQKSKVLPGLSIGYLNQVGPNQPTNFRIRYGITLPLWFWNYSSQIKAAKYQYQMSQSQYAIAQKTYSAEYTQALNDFSKYTGSLNYYEQTGLKQAETIISTSKRSYDAGEISYVIYMQSLNQAFEIKLNYIETIRDYNQSIIELNYLKGQ